MVTNRELDDLRKIVSFTDTRVPDINGNLVPFGPGITAGSTHPEGVRRDYLVSLPPHYSLM